MKTIPLQFDKAKVISFLKTDANGHCILDSDCFTKELGFSLKQIKPIIKNSHSEGIDQPIYLKQQQMGVDCLDFLYWFATQLGISTHNSFRGRGFQARFLSMSILNLLQSKVS